MNDLKRQVISAVEDLAAEAYCNGNSWEDWCAPRLKLILEALEAANSTPDVHK